MSGENQQNESSYTYFEDLANETIYQIFDYLDMYHIYQAFFDLNSRFRNLLMNSNKLLKINMKYLSKVNAQHYYTQFILPNSNRISFLYLWNPCSINIGCPALHHFPNFLKLETLVLENAHCERFLDSLWNLPNLHSLIINQMDNKSTLFLNFDSILCLPILKYCKLHYNGKISFRIRHNFLKKESSIEHLIINSDFRLSNLLEILPYLPHLYRLSIDRINDLGSAITSTVANNLTHVSLNLNNIHFDRFEPIIIYILNKVEVLHISTNTIHEYLDAERWEQSIKSSMKLLRIFDLQYKYRIESGHPQHECHEMIGQLRSSFRTRQQWCVSHSSASYTSTETLQSIESYRRRDFMLYDEYKQENSQSSAKNNLNRVHHVLIQNVRATNDCSFYFPNVHELTILYYTCIPRHWIINNLNSILSLRQLKQISIESGTIYSHEILELLQFAPNCQKLIIDRIHETGEREQYFEAREIYERDIDSSLVYDRYLDVKEYDDDRDVELQQYSEQGFRLEQNHEVYQYTSNTNNVVDLTVRSLCDLNTVQLLKELFPRLQHLTINVRTDTFESVMECLLSKTNNSIHNLISLNIHSMGELLPEKVINQLESIRPDVQPSIEEIDRGDYYIWL